MPCPVGGIVYGFVPGEGPVRDLVVPVSGFGEASAHELVLRAAFFLAKFRHPPLLDHLRKGAPFLYAQLICGDVFRPPGYDLFQRFLQNLLRHSRHSGNQIDTDGAGGYLPMHHSCHSGRSEGIPKDTVRLPGAIGRVPAVHPAQDSVVQRLHPHADACYAQVQQPLHISGAPLYDVLGIDLDGEFGVVGMRWHFGRAMPGPGGLYGTRPGPLPVADGIDPVENLS